MANKARSRPKERFSEFIDHHTGQYTKVYKKDIAKKMGISPQTFSARLRDGNFNCNEMAKIFKMLKATNEEILEVMKGE